MTDEFKTILNNLNVIDIQPTEIITFTVDFNSINPKQCKYIFDILTEKFPNNTVIMLPDKCSIESLDKERLRLWIDGINAVLEEE